MKLLELRQSPDGQVISFWWHSIPTFQNHISRWITLDKEKRVDQSPTMPIHPNNTSTTTAQTTTTTSNTANTNTNTASTAPTSPPSHPITSPQSPPTTSPPSPSTTSPQSPTTTQPPITTPNPNPTTPSVQSQQRLPAQRPISLQQQKVEARRARNPDAGKRKYNPDPNGLD